MFLTKFEVRLVRRTSIVLPVDEDLYSARVNEEYEEFLVEARRYIMPKGGQNKG